MFGLRHHIQSLLKCNKPLTFLLAKDREVMGVNMAIGSRPEYLQVHFALMTHPVHIGGATQPSHVGH